MEANNTFHETEEEIVLQKQGNAYILSTLSGTVGEITFRLVEAGTWVIDHTYVDPRYRGHQLGKQLLNMVVREARDKGRKIIPSCAFALEEFKKDSTYADVWEKGKSTSDFSDHHSSGSAIMGR
ncbi:putative GNAT family acetyltransferase [Paenibacillus qinlingensis]|uniref:GNAT family acetyltransferase n=2 Tax=Paenibacillus qinlingensis TaxID=1837343 RepID=A0ABU1NTI9_9BACL|nr:GNAT family N-acetyltransferase [Paenibacillus qinlingensis]MDR6550801.1 putative GNAT family acetyltransferase [Paenibacillus qinlingensis]